jgi:N-acetylglucosamine kinase-like BadF-type ATPase
VALEVLTCIVGNRACGKSSFVAIFLGIDGGGSQTSCAIGDETSLLGSGVSAGSNVIRVGEAQTTKSIASAIRQACAAAKVTPKQIKRTCIGVAGGARPETTEVIRRILSQLISGEIDVVGDMVIAMDAASGSGSGVVVIAGTGSIAYGRTAEGQTARAGGWGFAISDEGSGHWIGRVAVTAALRAGDEGQNGGLLESLMKAWGVNTREQLIVVSNTSPPPDFAGLFPAVLAAVEAGDPRAHDILALAGVELATLGKIVITRLFADAASAPVAISGGVFRNSALVRQVFYNRLRLECPNAVVNLNLVDPVKGALDLARRAALGPKPSSASSRAYDAQ